MMKLKSYFTKDSNIKYIVITIFFISVILRTILGILFGQMNVFYDELLHWNLSKSIYYHLGSNFRNDMLSYKEILYSIIISVSHNFGNTEIQYYVAVGINSILMSSVVFPVYVMSDKFLNNKCQAGIISILSIIIPEMAYTAKIIQEDLYYPMVIWFFFLFIILILKNQYSIKNIILLSFYVFLISLCKQMALNVFLGVILYYVIQFLFLDKENRKRCLISLIWFIGIFIGFKFSYGILFNIINGITSISSSEVTINVILKNLLDISLLMELIYPAVTYVLLSILFLGYFTVILPLSIVKELTNDERNLFILIGTIFTSTIMVICLRIIPSENFDDVIIRFHFRYIFFLLIPLLILFFSIYHKVMVYIDYKKLLVMSLIYVILLNYINIIPAEGSKIDCVGANYIKYLFDTEMMIKTYYILIVLGIMMLSYFIYRKKLKLFYTVMIICFILSGVISSAYTYSKYYVNKIESVEKKNDAFTINSYFHDIIKSDMSNLLIISDSKVSDAKLEVYLQYPNYYFCKKVDFNDFRNNYPDETFNYLNLYSFNKQFNDNNLIMPEYIITFEPMNIDGYKKVDINLKHYYCYKKV